MIKCPNCGSTAQMKKQLIFNNARTEITEILTCGCGCNVTAVYKLHHESTRTKDGTQIGHRKGDE